MTKKNKKYFIKLPPQNSQIKKRIRCKFRASNSPSKQYLDTRANQEIQSGKVKLRWVYPIGPTDKRVALGFEKPPEPDTNFQTDRLLQDKNTISSTFCNTKRRAVNFSFSWLLQLIFVSLHQFQSLLRKFKTLNFLPPVSRLPHLEFAPEFVAMGETYWAILGREIHSQLK